MKESDPSSRSKQVQVNGIAHGFVAGGIHVHPVIVIRVQSGKPEAKNQGRQYFSY